VKTRERGDCEGRMGWDLLAVWWEGDLTRSQYSMQDSPGFAALPRISENAWWTLYCWAEAVDETAIATSIFVIVIGDSSKTFSSWRMA
jgi:hypothetical protein